MKTENAARTKRGGENVSVVPDYLRSQVVEGTRETEVFLPELILALIDASEERNATLERIADSLELIAERVE
jgi:hypothetical protein